MKPDKTVQHSSTLREFVHGDVFVGAMRAPYRRGHKR